jgi:hypothetical protein
MSSSFGVVVAHRELDNMFVAGGEQDTGEGGRSGMGFDAFEAAAPGDC